MAITIENMLTATDEQLDRSAADLRTIADTFGLAGLRHAGRGNIVADVAPGRTYFDLAGFEAAAAQLLGAAVFVTPSGAPGAARMAGRPLLATSAA
jgi:hypothetical protein